MAVGIRAVGGYVSDRTVTNAEIAANTGKTPAWIEERIGIRERRYAHPGHLTSDLGVFAIRDLQTHSPGALEGVERVICATATPDRLMPDTAPRIAHRVGLDGVLAYDVGGVCAGMLIALGIGADHVRADGTPALVLGTDRYSSILDQSDPRTAPIFGDGAAAIVLHPVEDGYGIIAFDAATRGGLADLVRRDGGGTQRPLTHHGLDVGEDRFRMEGRQVAAFVTDVLPPMIHGVVASAGLTYRDISRFVMHQANPVLLRELTDSLGIPPDRVPIVADRWGNGGAASVGLALWDTHRTNPIRRGQNVLLAAVGGGMNAVVTLVRWS